MEFNNPHPFTVIGRLLFIVTFPVIVSNLISPVDLVDIFETGGIWFDTWYMELYGSGSFLSWSCGLPRLSLRSITGAILFVLYTDIEHLLKYFFVCALLYRFYFRYECRLGFGQRLPLFGRLYLHLHQLEITICPARCYHFKLEAFVFVLFVQLNKMYDTKKAE